MGKESEKEQIHVCVQLNHSAVHLKLTQCCKSTILQYKIKIKKKEHQHIFRLLSLKMNQKIQFCTCLILFFVIEPKFLKSQTTTKCKIKA